MASVKLQILINATSNMLSHFVRVFIGIFMTPFLLSRLGADVYGILPLVNSCVAFLVLASGGIQSSVGRYATLNLSKSEFNTTNKYINTAFFLMAGVLLLAALPFSFLVIYFPSVLDVPAGYEMHARFVILMLGITLFIEMLSNPFSVGIYSKQRFELRNLVIISKQLLHVIIVVGTFIFIEANIIFIAASILFTTVVSSAAMMLISKRLVPTLRFSFSLFDKSKLKDIGTYSFWVIISQVSVLLLLNSDYIIINKLLGSKTVTDYSLAVRWNEMIRNVLMAAVAVITPFSTELEANREFDKLRFLLIRGLRIVLLLVMAPAILLCIFSKELLIVWVGSEYVHVVIIFWASVFPLIWIMTELPIRYILFGMGEVKWLSIAGLISAVLNICFSITLVLIFKLGAFGVALGTSISLSIKNLVFNPIYLKRVLKIDVLTFFGEFIRPMISALPMVCLALFLKSQFDLNGWLPLLSVNGICVVLFGISAYFFALTDDDKKDFWMICSKIFHFKGNRKVPLTLEE